MKIIVAIDGPKNEWHPSVDPKDKWYPSVAFNDLPEEENQIETTNALLNEINPPDTKRPPHGFGGGDVEFKPLHAITMHLTKSHLVTFYVCQQILVLRGMKFDEAMKKADKLIDKTADYMKYDNIVNTIKKAAIEKLTVGDNDTEIIFLHPFTNGGVAHNRNMIIHYVYNYMKGEEYTHFHFLDYSGQFGRVGLDELRNPCFKSLDQDVITPDQFGKCTKNKIHGPVRHIKDMTPGIDYSIKDFKSNKEFLPETFGENNDIVHPKVLAIKSNDFVINNGSEEFPKIMCNKDHTYIGQTIEALPSVPDDGKVRQLETMTYVQKTGDYGTRTMSLMNKYYPISLIKPGFSFINADMNEDLFMQQQINNVLAGKNESNQKPIQSIQYYNGVSKHVNLIHPFDLILKYRDNNVVGKSKQDKSISEIANKWYHFLYGGASISEYIHYIKYFVDKFYQIPTDKQRSDKEVILLNTEGIDTKYNKKGKEVKGIIKEGSTEPLYTDLLQKTDNTDASLDIFNNFEETNKDKDAKDILEQVYVSPLPLSKYEEVTGVVLIPMINYLAFCHPSNSYIIDYTFESSNDDHRKKTYVKMSADAFGKVVPFTPANIKDKVYYRCGWIYKAGDNYFKTVPVIINEEGIIHLNPRFEVKADEGYKNYLDEIIEINKSKTKLEYLKYIGQYDDGHGSTYDIYEMKRGVHTYTISVNNYAVVYPKIERNYDPEQPEASHAKIFGGANKTKKIMTFIMIVILITVLIIIIVCDGKECKWLQKQIHNETS